MDSMEYYGISRTEKRQTFMGTADPGIATHLAISGLHRKFRHICHLVIINGTFLLF